MVWVIRNPKEITPEWLTRLLCKDGCLSQGRVASVDVTSETSYTSTIAWLKLTYSDDAPWTAPIFRPLGDTVYISSECVYSWKVNIIWL